MDLLNFLRRKYAVYCPICRSELNVYAYRSDDSLIFKCIVCNKYYIKSSTSNILIPTDYGEVLNEQLKNIEDQQYYEGIRSSEALGPKWLKLLNRLSKKKFQ
ncbi:hypothetical protein J2Z69_001820 [Paenibacillus shirakamiensis]|uniref:Uncharacterized protein n=1 Tax=Paenibacillus shirakamiensis TaxID=1265935 RepID=A0ABS4JJK5_9BACL|nr:hypothetical protein [Paenibacillus shirakamiensis]